MAFDEQLADRVRMQLGKRTDGALGQPGVRLFDVTGRPMKGWILVGGAGIKATALDRWAKRGVEFGSSLPKKN